MLILKTEALAKHYILGKVKVPALKNLNMEIHAGEMISLLGPSGSGKTTLLNLLGLLDRPSSGRICLKDRPTESLNYQEMAKLRSEFLGFIFQSFNLFPVLNAFENIEYPLLFLSLSKKERQKRVWDALSEVQLREVALHRPDELSGGQRQRVAIARALVTQPLLILADEPTANLDSHSTETVMSVMQRLNRTKHTTFIVSTHDPRVIQYVTRVVKIGDGVIKDDTIQAPVANLASKRLSQ